MVASEDGGFRSSHGKSLHYSSRSTSSRMPPVPDEIEILHCEPIIPTRKVAFGSSTDSASIDTSEEDPSPTEQIRRQDFTAVIRRPDILSPSSKILHVARSLSKDDVSASMQVMCTSRPLSRKILLSVSKDVLCSFASDVLQLIEMELTLEHQVFWRMFLEHDTSMNGALDMREFCQAFSRLSEAISTQDLEVIMREVDSDRSGEIEFVEFINWWSSKSKSSLTEKLQSALSAEGAWVLVKTYTIDLLRSNPWELRLRHAEIDKVRLAVASYREILLAIRQWKAQSFARSPETMTLTSIQISIREIMSTVENMVRWFPDVQQLWHLFLIYDTSFDGTLDDSELRVALSEVLPQLTSTQSCLEMIMDQRRSVTFAQFLHSWHIAMKHYYFTHVDSHTSSASDLRWSRIEARLEKGSHESLFTALKAYERVLCDLHVWKTQQNINAIEEPYMKLHMAASKSQKQRRSRNNSGLVAMKAKNFETRRASSVKSLRKMTRVTLVRILCNLSELIGLEMKPRDRMYWRIFCDMDTALSASVPLDKFIQALNDADADLPGIDSCEIDDGMLEFLNFIMWLDKQKCASGLRGQSMTDIMTNVATGLLGSRSERRWMETHTLHQLHLGVLTYREELWRIRKYKAKALVVIPTDGIGIEELRKVWWSLIYAIDDIFQDSPFKSLWEFFRDFDTTLSGTINAVFMNVALGQVLINDQQRQSTMDRICPNGESVGLLDFIAGWQLRSHAARDFPSSGHRKVKARVDVLNKEDLVVACKNYGRMCLEVYKWRTWAQIRAQDQS